MKVEKQDYRTVLSYDNGLKIAVNPSKNYIQADFEDMCLTVQHMEYAGQPAETSVCLFRQEVVFNGRVTLVKVESDLIVYAGHIIMPENPVAAAYHNMVQRHGLNGFMEDISDYVYIPEPHMIKR